MAIEGLMKEGFVTTSLDKVINWARTGLSSLDDFWTCMLRC